jgi:hypothetical protein
MSSLSLVGLKVNHKYGVHEKIRDRMPMIGGKDDSEYTDFVNEEIFPMMHNLKNDLFELKRSMKAGKNSRIRPDNHIDVKDPNAEAAGESREAVAAYNAAVEKMKEEGNKTALIADASVPKMTIYSFELENYINSFDEEKHKVDEKKEKKEKKEEFKEGKTKMLETDTEKKLEFNPNYRDNYVNIDITES